MATVLTDMLHMVSYRQFFCQLGFSYIK